MPLPCLSLPAKAPFHSGAGEPGNFFSQKQNLSEGVSVGTLSEDIYQGTLGDSPDTQLPVSLLENIYSPFMGSSCRFGFAYHVYESESVA